MDLNEIVVFARVVETRSFTAAAAQLGLPKSTVSRKVAQLEERLGVRLLQRTTRKLNLTEVGQAYYERCARIVADISAAEQLVTEMQTAPRGLLRVTAPIDFGTVYLGRVLADFIAANPDITVELDLSDRVVDLIEDGVDLAIRMGPLAESSLVARKLGAVALRLYAAPSYLARRGTPAKLAELADHDTVQFVPAPRLQTWGLRGPDGDVEITPGARVVSNNLFVVRDAAVAGAGIALLSELAVGDDLAAGRLVEVLPAWSIPESEVFAVYPSTRNLSPKVRVFLEFLVGWLTPAPWAAATSGRG
jgi:DNA-binding transcriptional LysR family regulator